MSNYGEAREREKKRLKIWTDAEEGGWVREAEGEGNKQQRHILKCIFQNDNYYWRGIWFFAVNFSIFSFALFAFLPFFVCILSCGSLFIHFYFLPLSLSLYLSLSFIYTSFLHFSTFATFRPLFSFNLTPTAFQSIIHLEFELASKRQVFFWLKKNVLILLNRRHR